MAIGKQLTIYTEIERRELEEDNAEVDGPVGVGMTCPVCKQPITPAGWCPCKITRA